MRSPTCSAELRERVALRATLRRGPGSRARLPARGPNGSSATFTRPRSGYVGRHGADRRERAVLAVEDDAGKGRELGGLQTRLRAASSKYSRIDRLARLQPQIGRQHFARLLIDRATDATGEEADRGQRRDGDQQREQQHAQLAGLAVAGEREKGESQRLHHADQPSGVDADDAAAALRDRLIVRDDDQRGLRRAIQVEQQLDDALAGRLRRDCRSARPRTAPPAA